MQTARDKPLLPTVAWSHLAWLPDTFHRTDLGPLCYVGLQTYTHKPLCYVGLFMCIHIPLCHVGLQAHTRTHTTLVCRVKSLRTCCHTARHCNVGLKACAHVATHTTLICRVKGLRTCCHTARHCYVGLKACAHVATHTTLICRVKVLRTCYQQHGRHAHTLCWNANVHRMGSRHEVQGYTFGTVRQIKLLPQQSEKRLSTSKTVI